MFKQNQKVVAMDGNTGEWKAAKIVEPEHIVVNGFGNSHTMVTVEETDGNQFTVEVDYVSGDIEIQAAIGW